ncbi:Ubiquinone/menaquinone biosynthesis C-methylase UbiE [Evansella caseinilytica]|uniref:Ubiquinone/menaquinone biosynthesis C-methylase UbiE n=1 Tax=Evansella caseinilytica TaxID=1503961 RepID=A0A1H3HT40_9BACI|nr:class I SAM-dependent methyltransferase [Evansella caseinilytica]SDY17958.1 Ubiquinone/menaquinone biosynthesis C-methylase UbiE [Evansella caseinilytica]
MGNLLPAGWMKDVLQHPVPEKLDDNGIVRVGEDINMTNSGTKFHQAMARGSQLNALQYQPFHLAYWETPYYNKAIKKFLAGKQPSDAVALDLGCGDGRFTQLLISLGFDKIIAVDADYRSLEALANTAVRAGYREKLLLIQAGAGKVPLNDRTADVVLAIGVLYYLNEDYESGLHEVSRLLQTNGIAVIAEPDLEGASLKALLYDGIDDFFDTITKQRFLEFHETHKEKFRLFRREELVALFRKHHLTVNDYHGISIFPSILRLGMKKGQLTDKAIRQKEDEIRKSFDFLDDHGKVFKHIIWSCRKEAFSDR